MKIDCYEFLKQITKENKDLIPYKIIINYEIDDNDYYEDYLLEAKCVVDSFSEYEFSIVSTTLKKYEEIECVGYDLMKNPNIGIRPKLISPDSFSKRLSLQLNKELNKEDTLKIRIEHKSYGSMSGNKRYIIRGLNYKKILLGEYSISFKFKKRIPNDIRVYEVNSLNNTYHYLYKIIPDTSDSTMFNDYCSTKNVNRHSKRIYVF